MVYSWKLNPGRPANWRPDMQIFLTQVVKLLINFLPVFRNRHDEMQQKRKSPSGENLYSPKALI